MEMKISKKTHPKKIAGAIFNAVQEHGSVDCVAIGGGALNNLNKAMIIAKGFFVENGQKANFDPSFDKAVVPDKGEVVSIKWVVSKA